MALANAKPGIIDRLASMIGGVFNRPPDIYNFNNPTISRGIPVYPNPNAVRFIHEGYCGNATIYTVISTAARKFGYLPRFVYKIEDKTANQKLKSLIKQREYKGHALVDLQKKAYNEQVVDNAFAELLAKPNSGEGQDSFYSKILTYYMSTGEAFIWLNRGLTPEQQDTMSDEEIEKMPVLEMYSLPSQYMEIQGDPDNVWGVIGYIFNQNGKRIPLRKSDVIHWKMPNPKFDTYTRIHMRGLSPLEPMNKLMTQNESGTDAAVAMQQNDGAKAIIFDKSMKTMDALQKSTLEGVINRKVNNRDMKGAVAAVQGDWGAIDLSMSSVDMQLIESQEKTFIRICNAYGINPMMFLANTTYENIKEARKDLITGLLLPMSCSLRDEMNRMLLPAFGLDKTFTHDVDVTNLPELQEDMTLKVGQLAAAWWLTPNQKLEEMNEDKSTDSLMDKVWVPNTIILMDDAAVSDTLNSFSDGGTNPKNSGSNLPDPLQGKPGKGNNGSGLPDKTNS